MSETINLFVPGRLCLFGEHSDWASGHRRQNSEIEKGYAIIAPTNQGNYARARKIPSKKIIYRTSLFKEFLEAKLEPEELLKIAEQGDKFSYVAGVAHEIKSSYNHFENSGIEIDNYHTDLPTKKGLSSSASVCVLVAKAFNELYDLKFTERRIMDIAYLGETTTPSRCGRLDQACVYEKPVLMTFDADRLDVNVIISKNPMYFVVVDLNKGKNTKKILSDLNKGFPFPTNDSERIKHNYFRENKRIVQEAVQAIIKGDSVELGRLMTEAQEKFDKYLAPACPDELTAPKLHQILNYSKIQDLIYGGKGVGSQGDGTAQFIAKNEESQKKLINVLNSNNELDVSAFPLTIS